MRLIFIVFLTLTAGVALAQDRLRMAVTTSFENAGLAEVLLPAIRADLNLQVDLLVAGTGQALRLGQAGDVDALLVHAPVAEADFVTAGHAPYRRPIMYNDFVLVGPDRDPLGLRGMPIAPALTAIAMAQAPFVSRGDDSGTHKAELALWAAAGLTLDDFGRWYKPAGSGMGATLNTAMGLGAYVLTDRATWLSFGNPQDGAILVEGDALLFNQYSFLPVSPTRHPHVRFDLAQRLEDWLTSPRAAALINGYRVHDTQLFTFNARVLP